jgi:hypothetical protein
VNKKSRQLGMHHSTASARLLKDLLFMFVSREQKDCFRCHERLTRGTFSIEHIEPWLDSDDPRSNFFNLSNISFSHLSCNVRARRQTRFAQHGTHSKYTKGCSCDECKEAHRKYKKKNYSPEKRRKRYLKNGK